MRDDVAMRRGERGAVSIGTILTLLVAASVIFAVIKIVPVYAEERRVIYDVEDLASKSTVRESKTEEIQKRIQQIRLENELPEGSINLLSREKGVQIGVSYSRTIDLLVTTYVWKVDHKAVGKSL